MGGLRIGQEMSRLNSAGAAKPRRANARRERGSIVVLAPAIAVLAVTLAALLLDLNFLYTTKAELADRVEAAATAAANNISLQSYYGASSVAIDPSVARRIALTQLAGHIGHGYRVSGVVVSVLGNSVCIHASAAVDLPAFSGLLGGSPLSSIDARSIATLPSPNGSIATAPIPSC